MLPKRFFTRNADMMLVPNVGLCRASMFVPLSEQGIVMKESELLRKNVLLPTTIPLMAPF